MHDSRPLKRAGELPKMIDDILSNNSCVLIKRGVHVDLSFDSSRLKTLPSSHRSSLRLLK